MRKLKIGILGTANIAIRSVIPALKLLPNQFELIGVASRDGAKARKVAAELHLEPFEQYEAILDVSKIDVIYIPLPNSMHHQWVKIALNLGIHVLVEKSLGCSLEEVIFLNILAKEKGLVLIENFQFRFHRQLSSIQALIKNDQIGELRCLRASFGFPPFKDKANIRYTEELGGGALLDAAAYTTKISQILLGNNLEVKGATLNYQDGFLVDIWGGAYLENPNSGIFSQVSFGFDHFYQCGIEIWGSKGRIRTNRLFTAPSDYKPIILLEKDHGSDQIEIEPDNHFVNMLLHLYQLIETKKGIMEEYSQNIDQSRLLSQIKIQAHG